MEPDENKAGVWRGFTGINHQFTVWDKNVCRFLFLQMIESVHSA